MARMLPMSGILLAICFSGALGADWTFSNQSAWTDSQAATDNGWTCGGNRQSPIDIITSDTVRDPNLDDGFEFSTAMGQNMANASYTNKGYTMQMDNNEYDTSPLIIHGADLPIDPSDYTFLQFHFHWGTESLPGSEHLIDGKRFMAEVHFVFKSKATALADDNSLTVLGFFIEIDTTTGFEHGGQWKTLLDHIATLSQESDTANYIDAIAISDLIPMYNPSMKKFYHYNGSLTTPPCYEVVNWYVFEDPIYISQDQYDKFFLVRNADNEMPTNTYRFTQPLNGRIVRRTLMATVSPKTGPNWSFANQAAWVGTPEAAAGGWTCNGNRQSPINIDTESTVHDSNLDVGFTFAEALGMPISQMDLANKGYTFQLTDEMMNSFADSMNLITQRPRSATDSSNVDDYAFWQYHFHWGTTDNPGSEHTINGKRFAAELHFVFKSKHLPLITDNSLTVLGFFIEKYDGTFLPRGPFADIMNELGDLIDAGSHVDWDNMFALTDLLPLNDPEVMSKFFHYKGSLTTPPCLEVVNWYVFEDPIYVSEAQFSRFLAGRAHNGELITDTYRAVQPLNDRVVYRTKTADSNTMRMAIGALIVALFARIAL